MNTRAVTDLYPTVEEEAPDPRTWADGVAPMLRARPVAYFSMEFGIHESLPIYSGGLGVLAGDHLKSASDLGVPLIAVGLFYREGYFRQSIDGEGRQRESYPAYDPAELSLQPVRDPSAGEPILVRVETRKGAIAARAWEARVGRVRLLLLDSDVPENSEEDRALTHRLYGGDGRTRIRQELLLGVGGARVLEKLQIRPGVLHLNEGHCAFAALELARQHRVEESLDFAQAQIRTARRTVFTTHTPVPAGHDRFDANLLEEHIGPLRDQLGIDERTLLALGRTRPDDADEPFCMTVLALHMARKVNGVSQLHGHVSREMWAGLWPGRSESEVPIGHITNGVHVPTWLATPMQRLLEKTNGSDWLARQTEASVWSNLDQVEDRELWQTHVELKSELITFVRQRAAAEAETRGEPGPVVEALRKAFAPDRLTVGFARRFATYKRATLLLEDPEALDRLVNHPERPLQLVFAGKAHPRDEGGKDLLQRVHRMTRDPRFLGKIVFLENYDIQVGRALVQGVDVWLNNPRRPHEASGTSGEKVMLNGGLHCSVLDGWWAEAWDGLNGFAIGRGLASQDLDAQDRRDYQDLLRVLTDEVVPLFYCVGSDGLPAGWIQRVRRSIRTLAPRFNSDRMVMDYVTHCYLPAVGGLPQGGLSD